MKRFIIFCLALGLCSCLFAQEVKISEVHRFLTPIASPSGKSVDTLYPPVFATHQICSDSSVYYRMPTGYLTGNGTISGFTLTECSQAFDNAISCNIIGAFLLVNVVSANGGGSIIIKGYNVNASFKPTSSLGNLDTVLMSDLSVGMNMVPLTFTTPVAVTGNFAIDVVFPTTSGDTMCMAQTPIGCRDSLKDSYAYVDLSGYGWLSYKSMMAMQPQPKGSFDLFIFAYRDNAGGIYADAKNPVLNIYPNPANDNVTIASSNKIKNIKLMDCLGQIITSSLVDNYFYKMNTSTLNNGIYIARIETRSGIITKKITINR